ncbi:MAG: hypothetical protein LVQ64_04045 [Thermoplasmatales archaeon]|nr:hypothetical protein [Thermoplasmatales archaeon]
MGAANSLSVGGWQFITILLLIFGLFLVLAGAFTAYFGSGRSRGIGVALLVVGLVVGLLFAFVYSYYGSPPHQLGTLLWQSFLVIIAAVIGALAAIGIFLVAIMKS